MDRLVYSQLKTDRQILLTKICLEMFETTKILFTK